MAHELKDRARLAVTMLTWLWAGLLLGVSFVATPVKFLAPSVSLADALAVGRVTFEALKWIECAALAALVLVIYMARPKRHVLVLPGAIVAILLCQYVWMLPILDARVETIIDGQNLSPSLLHWVYTALEFLKVALLVAVGFTGHPSRR